MSNPYSHINEHVCIPEDPVTGELLGESDGMAKEEVNGRLNRVGYELTPTVSAGYVVRKKNKNAGTYDSSRIKFHSEEGVLNFNMNFQRPLTEKSLDSFIEAGEILLTMDALDIPYKVDIREDDVKYLNEQLSRLQRIANVVEIYAQDQGEQK